jgi:hypothetical protein
MGGGMFSRFSALNVAVRVKLAYVSLSLLQVSQEPSQLFLVLSNKLLEQLLEYLLKCHEIAADGEQGRWPYRKLISNRLHNSFRQIHAFVKRGSARVVKLAAEMAHQHHLHVNRLHKAPVLVQEIVKRITELLTGMQVMRGEGDLGQPGEFDLGVGQNLRARALQIGFCVLEEKSAGRSEAT